MSRSPYAANYATNSIWTVTIWMATGLAVWPCLVQASGEGEPPFVDRARETGLDVTYRNGMDETDETLHLLEITGGGAALFDFDGDGDLDVYLTQGHSLARDTPKPAKPPEPRGELRDRLFRNELVGVDGRRGELRFVDVTEASGLDARGYGMGVATGDVDHDGDVDLYVTNYGANQLWRNDGVGDDGIVTFTDVTAEAGAGVGDPRWSVAASFVDLDGDGRLDLYVGNYVDLSLDDPKTCRAATGELDYCGPLAYDPLPDRLLRNVSDADGIRFVDVTQSAGLGAAASGLGAASGDFDGDGRMDLFVANDGMANQLWLNRTEPGSGRIRMVDDALFAGTAFNADGQPEASMGVAVGDVDGDGFEDLLVTHLLRETHTLYLGRGGGAFLDATGPSGLGTASWMMTGFGTAFLDYDLDGDLDLLAANGAVTNFDRYSLSADDTRHWILAEGADRPGWRLHQPNQLFRNDTTRGDSARGSETKVLFTDVSAAAGDLFRRAEISRGVAVGDIDNDGDPDAVVVNVEEPLRLLIDRAGDGRPWLGVRALSHGRDAYGARVGLRLADGSHRWRRVRTDGSYASASDPRVVFALAGTGLEGSAMVRVEWPDGSVEDFAAAAGRYTNLVEGTGPPPESEAGPTAD